MSATPPVMWRPGADAATSAMGRFQRFVETRRGAPFTGWADFHAWSVDSFREHWAWFVEWSGVRMSGDIKPVCAGDEIETARFFPGARLSFTSHLLDGDGAPDDAIAIVECREGSAPRQITRGALRGQVARLAHAFQRAGIGAGDRVAGLVVHEADTVSVVLALAGLGANWSACGPELSHDAIISRLAQLEPKLLVVSGTGTSGGIAHGLVERARRLVDALPTVTRTLVLGPAAPVDWPHATSALGPFVDGCAPTFDWPALPFDQPLYVLFSSGTTGLPKAIVHGAGGTLLEHLKEHRLHGDLHAEDRLYYQTSCGWMMWHWTVSALATGAAIVTYDGAVGHPDQASLWRLACAADVTVLGASPAYWQFCRDAGVRPADTRPPRLRALLSTGSMLEPEWYDWVATEVGPVPLQSISGGSDILGCFVLGHPMLPVYRGESQCVSLALDVRAVRDDAVSPAELVCAAPFPSRPLGFLHDPDGSRFHEAYFAQRPGLWTHGDFVEITSRGTARILGRADAVLKAKGIRIGPAEVTAPALTLPEVREAMAVEQRHAESPGGSRIVLLVVLAPGMTLDRALTHRIKRAVRDRASADHVPGAVIAVPALLVTVNGKPSERAAREALNGQVPANLAALRDPALIDIIRALPEAQGA